MGEIKGVHEWVEEECIRKGALVPYRLEERRVKGKCGIGGFKADLEFIFDYVECKVCG